MEDGVVGTLTMVWLVWPNVASGMVPPHKMWTVYWALTPLAFDLSLLIHSFLYTAVLQLPFSVSYVPVTLISPSLSISIPPSYATVIYSDGRSPLPSLSGYPPRLNLSGNAPTSSLVASLSRWSGCGAGRQC